MFNKAIAFFNKSFDICNKDFGNQNVMIDIYKCEETNSDQDKRNT